MHKKYKKVREGKTGTTPFQTGAPVEKGIRYRYEPADPAVRHAICTLQRVRNAEYSSAKNAERGICVPKRTRNAEYFIEVLGPCRSTWGNMGLIWPI